MRFPKLTSRRPDRDARGAAPGRTALSAALVATSLSPLAGCASTGPDRSLISAAAVGEYGAARARLTGYGDRQSSDNLLDRVRLLLVDLADGQPRAAEDNANRIYEILRTQGINADRTVASVVFGDGVRYWKGEPFEQALAYSYVATQKAMIGDWGNCRAAAEGSLFLLRDFGENERGRRLTQQELAERAARQGDEYLESYQPVESTYVLGHFLSGLGSLALGDEQGAAERLAQTVALQPDLADAVEAIQSGRANTVFIVDFGLAPTKVGTGPQGAITTYEYNTWSDTSPLTVAVNAADASGLAPVEAPESFPVAVDVNAMSSDHSWRNLEDVRVAKAIIGQGLIVGGAVVATASDDSDAQLVGLGMILAGLAASATSSADTRHNELLPQRVYIAAVNIPHEDSTVRLDVKSRGASPLTLLGVDPPAGDRFQLRYVRMNAPGARPSWAVSDSIYYRSDAYDGPIAPIGDREVLEPLGDLPYIFGGQDVSTPSHESLARAQAAGYLPNYTLNDLANLYREEGLLFTTEDQRGQAARHILEGGPSLVAPLPGTAGFARLFQTPHSPFRPRSEALRAAVRAELERLRSNGLIEP